VKTIINLLVILFCLLHTPLLVASKTDMKYKGSYKPITDPDTYISNEFAAAQKENKRLVFVLGGNWCHDSRSLARKLDQDDLSQFIERNYRLSLIDIGYLEQGFEFLANADMQTFYATPTVLIFDPVTGQHINKSDMHIWGSAAKINLTDTYKYFDKYISKLETTTPNSLTKTQQQSIEKLEQFRLAQEQRIRSGYLVIGPLLKRYNAKDKDKNFDSYWGALATLRRKLPKDLKRLREQILENSDQKPESITLPEYAALPWE